MPPKFNLNAKTITAPLAAFTMATLLFVYSRTSIQAAKRNAQRHRDADGGQINWRNESLRRHGVLETVDEGTVGDVVGSLKGGVNGKGGKEGPERGQKGEGKVGETDEEKRVRERASKGRNA